jgi:hypothetical protein
MRDRIHFSQPTELNMLRTASKLAVVQGHEVGHAIAGAAKSGGGYHRRHAAALLSHFIENHIGDSFVVPTEMVSSL